MSISRVRVLTEDGSHLFRDYILRIRSGLSEEVPLYLLTDKETSDDLEYELAVGAGPFGSRFEFGQKLSQWLSQAERRELSRNSGLWNWLALYYFDYLCPADHSGKRKPLAVPHYVLEGKFTHNRYYRHLVRFAWSACTQHGEDAQVLLTAAGKASPGIGQWGDISEQLGGYQGIFGSRTVIGAACRMYVTGNGSINYGAASQSGKGSARRLAAVSKQLVMTHDLRTTSVYSFIAMLPKEFDRWKGHPIAAAQAEAVSASEAAVVL
jgi:hypothetical protein